MFGLMFGISIDLGSDKRPRWPSPACRQPAADTESRAVQPPLTHLQHSQPSFGCNRETALLQSRCGLGRYRAPSAGGESSGPATGRPGHEIAGQTGPREPRARA